MLQRTAVGPNYPPLYIGTRGGSPLPVGDDGPHRYEVLDHRGFFPNDHIRVVSLPDTGDDPPAPSPSEGTESALWHEMTKLILREIPVGPFRSVECQPVIRSRWLDHPMVRMSGQQFGAEFAGKLWPILEKRRVKLLGTKPRKYEMPKQAKGGSSPAGG